MADEGEALSSYKVMSLEVKQLLEDGLEDKTLFNLKDRLAAVQPQHLVRPLFSCRPITMLSLNIIESTSCLFFFMHEIIYYWSNILVKVNRSTAFVCLNPSLGHIIIF